MPRVTKITVMEVVDPQFGAPISYWIDIPCDVEFTEPSTRRVQIPRELALYLTQLQDSNKELKSKNALLELKLRKRSGRII